MKRLENWGVFCLVGGIALLIYAWTQLSPTSGRSSEAMEQTIRFYVSLFGGVFLIIQSFIIEYTRKEIGRLRNEQSFIIESIREELIKLKNEQGN